MSISVLHEFPHCGCNGPTRDASPKDHIVWLHEGHMMCIKDSPMCELVTLLEQSRTHERASVMPCGILWCISLCFALERYIFLIDCDSL